MSSFYRIRGLTIKRRPYFFSGFVWIESGFSAQGFRAALLYRVFFFMIIDRRNCKGISVADPGGGARGSGPPLLGHDVGFLTLGPKLDPLLDPPPFFCL